MEQVRPQLETFAAEMLGGLARSDQRAKGELYLRGLLVDGKRKSMQPMAARLGVDHQQLQQFVTSSTWYHVEVRKRVAWWANEFIEPEAYVKGLYRKILLRGPSEGEVERSIRLLEGEGGTRSRDAWAVLAQALLISNEFLFVD